MRKFGFFLVSMALTASCSSKIKNSGISGASSSANAVGAAPTSFYFADLQILTETSVDGDCSESEKITEGFRQDWKANLTDANEIYLADGVDFKYFVSNVTMEVMGFDSAQYSFSVVDGVMPKTAPFGLRLRRTPGQVLEIYFLDQIVRMKLLTTPVYTFSATEKRGACTIKHNVNVFAERVGYFKKERK